jgi:tRNA A-37 threonylcarbamoyl transferase component Bud32
MSEAVLDQVIERIADGSSVDWAAINGGTLVAGDNRWLACLRIINDVANLHRADALNLMTTEMPTAVATPMPGVSAGVPDVWGKYRLANRVGAGSYGAVYRAWDSDLERDVAMKILHDRFGDTRLKEKLLKEGRALARIRHHNVVQVFGVESHGDRVALCMEFVQGQTLDELVLRQRRLSAREAVGIGEDLCRALAAVHAAGYIHRDVKAKNVMRDEKGRILLMDFGTGRQADNPAALGDRAGTPLYMAPEVLEGEPASAASDVYSLGVLLYHLVTAQYPVEARTVDDLRDAHRHRRHRWLSERRPDLPVPFMQVVERAIALDAEERYANPSELLAALSALKLGPHPWVWRIAKPILAVAAVMIGMTTIGALTTQWFDLKLGRVGFVDETPLDWFLWGRLASFGPFVLLVMVGVPISALVVLRRVAIAMSSHLRALDEAARGRVRALAHRLRLDEAPVLGSCALILSTLAIVSAVWYFAPLLTTLLGGPLQNGTTEQFRLLSRDYVLDHNQYRQVFAIVVLFSVVVWYPVRKLVQKGQAIHWGMVAAGIAATSFALVLLHFPYRLMYYNDVFEAVMWNGSRCYVVGERGDQELLFCPGLQRPRNRIVSKSDPARVPLGITESLFKSLERSTTPSS